MALPELRECDRLREDVRSLRKHNKYSLALDGSQSAGAGALRPLPSRNGCEAMIDWHTAKPLTPELSRTQKRIELTWNRCECFEGDRLVAVFFPQQIDYNSETQHLLLWNDQIWISHPLFSFNLRDYV